MTKKNNSIEFIRFVLCLMVVMHHFRGYGRPKYFVSGYLSVDIFFVLSGFFMMRHFLNTDRSEPAEEAWGYLKSRLNQLVPHHLFSWFLQLFKNTFLLNMHSLSSGFVYGFWELILLKAAAIGGGFSVNGPAWYLSALLMCSYPIYWLLCCLRSRGDQRAQTYTHLIGPFLYLLIMGYIGANWKDLNNWTQPAVIFTGGFLRGMAEISLGCTAYAAAEYGRKYLAGRKYTDLAASVFELAGWFAVLHHMMFSADRADFIVPLLSAFLLISMYSFRSYPVRILDNKISGLLGRYSYAVYLNQFIFLGQAIRVVTKQNFWQVSCIMLAGLFIFSIISTELISALTERIRHYYRQKEADKHEQHK